MLLLLLPGGCAGVQTRGEKGSLVHTDDVRNIFESNTVLPDHVYYYSGPEAEPEAIIGIQAGLAFQGRYWHQVALSQGQLQSWNRRIDNAHRIRLSYRGARIMSPDGRQVGVWYSKYDHTVIRFPDANTILMYTPGSGFKNDLLEGDANDPDIGPGPRD
ncbi:MAG: hypothetical protein ACYC9M_01635 [Desulfobulbaceae bacterium]